MASSFPEAIAVVTAHKDELNTPDPDAYLATFAKSLDIKDDARASVLIAVDAAKSLITIGVAFFAALGAFALNFRTTHSTAAFSLSTILLAASAVLTIISMWTGFSALGVAYKAGQKPAGAHGIQWETKRFSGRLGAQSLLGLAALISFAAAVYAWQPQASDADAATARIDAALAAQGRRIDQLSEDLARLNQTMAANAQGLALLPGVARQMTDVGLGLAELRGRLAQLLPPPRQ